MLTEVKVEDLPKLRGIIERNIAFCNASKRTSFEYVQATITLHALSDSIQVFTDDLNDPHHYVIVSCGKFGVMDEVYGFINTIFSDEDHRSAEMVEEMVTAAKLWAKSKNTDVFLVSSWQYRGTPTTTELWKSLGFEVQEQILIQHF